MRRRQTLAFLFVLFLATAGRPEPPIHAQSVDSGAAACEALLRVRNLTITSARLVDSDTTGATYCHVRGILPPAIGFHVQLPLPGDWNGRFLQWGDGGKDGDLDLADHRVAEGYAVANSNTGHDNGAEPRSSFGLDNRQAEIDFGHRAVHLTVMAGKALVDEYYDRAPEYSYFEGCSTGGRQALMEAQRYPYDFDGIVAGAPVNYYQTMNVTSVWLLQQVYGDDLAGAPAFDTDGDGRLDSTRKVEVLADAVLARCDAGDGVSDGVLDDPLACDFDAERDLSPLMCEGDVDGDSCFTARQARTVRDFYRGSYDSQGTSIYPGRALGSERQWPGLFIPTTANRFSPGILGVASDHPNYLFYEDDPGVAVPDLADPSYVPDHTRTPPEWAWWQFDIDDVTRGKGDLMMSITDATDPRLGPFLQDNGGKLLMYHGWADALTVPAATLGYYQDVVDATFGGDLDAARADARFFLVPGMGHCGGGPGPNTWDRLAPLVDWVERGEAPAALVVTHRTDGVVDNERPVCAFPERAVYTGAGDADDPANWVASNFSCR